MQIDPYLIYAIAEEPGTEGNPYELPHPSYIEQKQAGLGLSSPIENYNWLLANIFKKKPGLIKNYLDYHFKRPDCRQGLFLYNLQYHLLELPSNGKYLRHVDDHFIQEREVSKAILEWIEGQQINYEDYGVYDRELELDMDSGPTIEQKVILTKYLQKIHQFPTFQDTILELRLLTFLTNHNPKSLYQSIRLAQEKEGVTNLGVVEEILQDAYISDALEMISLDIETIRRKEAFE